MEMIDREADGSDSLEVALTMGTCGKVVTDTSHRVS